ncbi:molecular chaperone [Adlercreutzia sp. ZJ473]|uniref:TorD/DmsD family molecular chaperone n=1 Tax=Adlercreutzia sp. ZJ473 TaxID=2722822 RepID=UPI0015553894|nr:molecular chaperone TorD family protein [Adlercreutzia sp. ZJ473]
MNCVDALKQESLSLGFLASAFLLLPDKQLVRNLRDLPFAFAASSNEPGALELAAYAQSIQGKTDDEVLRELGTDRAKLIRHVDAQCINPPYESLYANEPESDVVQSLNRLFIEAGFAPSGKYCEASDQIGMELSFMKFCVDREIEATLEEDEDAARAIAAIKDRFFDEHLGRWMASYGEAMRRSAQTGYYRAIADLLTSLSS